MDDAITGVGGGQSVIVAASNASASARARADYRCDGVADEAEINVAINSLSTAPQGRVVLSEGLFSISSDITILYDNIALVGVGRGARGGGAPPLGGTRISPTADFAGSAFVNVQSSGDTKTLACVLLRDFVVDGTNLSGPFDGVIFRGNRGVLDNVYVTRCTGHGFHFGAPSGWSTFDTKIVACQGEYSGLNGFFIDTRASDVVFLGCNGNNNTGDGWKVAAATIQLQGCHAYDNTANGIEFASHGFGTRVIGTRVEGNNGGIVTTGTQTGQVGIVGCTFRNNSPATTNTTDHISLGASSHGVVISGNTFYADTANKARYGVNITAGATGTVLVGNSIPTSSVATSPVNDGGTGTVNTGNYTA